MNDLLETAIEAHGGLARWKELHSVSWDEAGQRWRRLRLYFDQDGLLTRHDYEVEISGGTPAAHYISGYAEAAGIMVPTRHRIFPRAPDGRSLAEPLVVSIDLSEIAFTPRLSTVGSSGSMR